MTNFRRNPSYRKAGTKRPGTTKPLWFWASSPYIDAGRLKADLTLSEYNVSVIDSTDPALLAGLSLTYAGPGYSRTAPATSLAYVGDAGEGSIVSIDFGPETDAPVAWCLRYPALSPLIVSQAGSRVVGSNPNGAPGAVGDAPLIADPSALNPIPPPGAFWAGSITYFAGSWIRINFENTGGGFSDISNARINWGGVEYESPVAVTPTTLEWTTATMPINPATDLVIPLASGGGWLGLNGTPPGDWSLLAAYV